MSYGLGQEDRELTAEEEEQRLEQSRVSEFIARAKRAYPGVPLPEALDLFNKSELEKEEKEIGKGKGENIHSEAWPIIAAMIAGLVIFTFMRR